MNVRWPELGRSCRNALRQCATVAGSKKPVFFSDSSLNSCSTNAGGLFSSPCRLSKGARNISLVRQAISLGSQRSATRRRAYFSRRPRTFQRGGSWATKFHTSSSRNG